ncbi:hypothetical protein HDU86_005268 [Geranomyces michiganensis]|nr:hypothetical protein HDU86_005268 [Geranomyces michiganensis]
MWSLVFLVVFLVLGQIPLTEATLSLSPRTVKVAIILPFGYNVNAPDRWYIQHGEAARLAFRHAQSDALLPNTVFDITDVDFTSEANPAGTLINSAVRMMDNKPVFVIGPDSSSESYTAAAVTGLYAVPECAPGAGGYQLSNKADYPYFFRGVGSFADRADNWSRFAAYNGWLRIGLLYGDDALGETYTQFLPTYAAQHNITIVLKRQLTSLMDPVEVMESMRAVDVHVFIVGTGKTAYSTDILYGALQTDMLGPNYVWMFPNDPVADLYYNWDLGNHKIGRDVFDWIGQQNLFSFATDPDVSSSPAAIRFATDWKLLNGTRPILRSPRAAPYVGMDQDDFYTGLYYDCASAWLYGLTEFLAKQGSDADTILQKIVDHDLQTLKLLKPATWNTSHPGVQGPFDYQANGDRIMTLGVRQNGADGKSVIVGKLKFGMPYSPVTTIKFVSGTTIPPVDQSAPPPHIYAEPSRGLMGAYIAISTVLIVITLGFGVYLTMHKNLRVIKSASYPFLNLILLGAVVTYSDIIVFMSHNSDWNCIVHSWLKFLGFAILFGALMVKTFRIAYLFTTSKAKAGARAVMDERLSAYYVIYLLFFVGALIIWTIIPSQRPFVHDNVEPVIQGKTIVQYNHNQLCEYHSVHYVLLAFELLTLLTGTFLAIRVRNTPGAFNESKWLGISIYNYAVFGILLSIASAIVKDVNINRAIEGALAFICSSTVIGCIFLPKFLIIRSGHGDDAAATFETPDKNTRSSVPARPTADNSKYGEVLAVYREEYQALRAKAAQAGVQLPDSEQKIRQAEETIAVDSRRSSLATASGSKAKSMPKEKQLPTILATETDSEV